MVSNIFVVGLDPLNSAVLRRLPGASNYRFHQLLTPEELREGTVSVPELLASAQRQLDSVSGSIDAIVGYWDFPVSMLVPILRERYGMKSASLRAVVACEHKYWSRRIQREVIAEVPAFGLLDLHAPVPYLPENMDFPVWIKPVKSVASEGAYYVRDAAALVDATKLLRQKIDRIGRPFEDILGMLELPPEVAAVGGRACIVEEPALGRLFTVEGFAHDGAVVVYGVVESINYPDSSSFLRYQYPGSLPAMVRRRFVDLSERVVAAMGLDHTTFNIEYFWDPATDRVRLLEINTRHSQSHALLFEMVDGTANHAYMVDIALGREPHPESGQGPYAIAAKWFLRHFRDGIVRRVPTVQEVEALEAEVPGTVITIEHSVGDRLSQSSHEDSYSFVLAEIFTGGQDEADLQRKYARCLAGLHFEVETLH